MGVLLIGIGVVNLIAVATLDFPLHFVESVVDQLVHKPFCPIDLSFIVRRVATHVAALRAIGRLLAVLAANTAAVGYLVPLPSPGAFPIAPLDHPLRRVAEGPPNFAFHEHVHDWLRNCSTRSSLPRLLFWKLEARQRSKVLGGSHRKFPPRLRNRGIPCGQAPLRRRHRPGLF